MKVTEPLTILHAPCHGPSLDVRAIKFATSLGADSIGWTEAYRRVPALRRRVRYRTRVGNPNGVPRATIRGAHDVPIMVHRRRRLLDWYAVKACDPSTPIKIAPDRWITGVIYDHPIGTIEHIALHPNAGVEGLTREVDRVDKYARTMERLASLGTRALNSGHHLIVSGDLNYRAGHVAPWTPDAVFSELDLDTWRVGIDWIAYSPHLRLRTQDEHGPTETRSDHPWMFARFVL